MYFTRSATPEKQLNPGLRASILFRGVSSSAPSGSVHATECCAPLEYALYVGWITCTYIYMYTKTKFEVATFQLHFSDLTLMTLKRILPKNVQFNGLKLCGAFEEISITLQFLCSKMQKNRILKKIRVFLVQFFTY